MAHANPVENRARVSYPPAKLKTTTATATPKTPPSCRNVLKTPEARPISASGTALTAAFCAAGSASEIPSPPTSNGTSRPS